MMYLRKSYFYSIKTIEILALLEHRKVPDSDLLPFWAQFGAEKFFVHDSSLALVTFGHTIFCLITIRTMLLLQHFAVITFAHDVDQLTLSHLI